MSLLGRATYSREVRALPSSYHTGCTQTSLFYRKFNTCCDGHLDARPGEVWGGLSYPTSFLYRFCTTGCSKGGVVC